LLRPLCLCFGCCIKSFIELFIGCLLNLYQGFAIKRVGIGIDGIVLTFLPRTGDILQMKIAIGALLSVVGIG